MGCLLYQFRVKDLLVGLERRLLTSPTVMFQLSTRCFTSEVDIREYQDIGFEFRIVGEDDGVLGTSRNLDGMLNSHLPIYDELCSPNVLPYGAGKSVSYDHVVGG